MAEINTRKRGNKWEYYFEIANVNGKRKRISKSGFNTKKEAISAGSKAFNEYNNCGLKFIPSELSVSDYLDYWMEVYCKTNLKNTTIANYNKKIKNHIKPAIGVYKIKSITPATLQEFINTMYQKEYSKNTLSVIKGILTNSFNYAVHPLEFIRNSPMQFVRIPKNQTKTTRVAPHIFIPKEKFNEIIERFPQGSSVYLPLMFGYRCGMRIGEAYAITWDNVNFEKETITINKQIQWNETKSKWYFSPPKYNSIRTIDVDNELLNYLKTLQAKQQRAKDYYEDLYTYIYQDENMFIYENISNGVKIDFVNVRENGGFIQPRTMQHTSHIIHTKLNFTEFDFHSLRHTHCTTLLENGFSPKYVQQRLGHKNLKFTMDIYNHLTDKQSDEGKCKLNELY